MEREKFSNRPIIQQPCTSKNKNKYNYRHKCNCSNSDKCMFRKPLEKHSYGQQSDTVENKYVDQTTFSHELKVNEMDGEYTQWKDSRSYELNSLKDELTVMNKSPEVQIKIGEKKFKAMIDTGCEISVISQDFFRQHYKSVMNNASVLPISEVKIKTACGTLIKNVKQQILIKIQIEEVVLEVNFVIIDKLIHPMILGVDFLYMGKCILDFTNKCLLFREKNIKVNFILEDTNLERTEKRKEIAVMETKGKDADWDDTKEWQQYQQDTRGEGTPGMRTVNRGQSVQIFFPKTKTISDNNYKCESEVKTKTVQNLEIQIKQKIDNLTQITEEQRLQLQTLFYKYIDIFRDEPGLCNKYKYRLTLKDTNCIVKRSYPVPFKYLKQVDEEIQRMLQLGIIKESKTDFINPMVVVPKGDNKIRLCIDGRFLNEKLESDPISMEPIDIALLKCKSSKFISTMDLNASYWQIPLEEECKKYTGFIHRTKSYVFNVVPFGLKVSLGALLRAMDAVFRDPVDDFAIFFVDDILCNSGNFNEHCHHLENIFSRLADANMTINLNKSNFIVPEVKFLGYIINEKGIKPDPRKVELIKQFPKPKNTKQLKSFLGLTNFYQRFCRGYSDYIKPLLRLTSKKQKWQWTKFDDEQFKLIKEKFLETVMLHHVDYNKPYYLNTDASRIAIGGVLYQIADNGDHNVVLFMNRTLNKSEQNYSVFELECLSVVWCLKRVRHYVMGSKVHIKTDNLALTHLKTTKFLNSRMSKWVLELQEYDFTIEHIKATENRVADLLSRTTLSKQYEEDYFTLAVFKYNIDSDLLKKFKNIGDWQKRDGKINLIRLGIQNNMDENQTIEDKTDIQKYVLVNDILYKFHKDRYKVVIPEAIQNKFIWQMHYKYSHLGGDKIFKLINETCIWKNMGRHIRQTLATCTVCQECKYDVYINKAPLGHVKVNEINKVISIDYIGPLIRARGNLTYILTIVDCFSKYVTVFPLRRADTKQTINKLQTYFTEHGTPQAILSDHGTQFQSEMWKTFLKDNGIKQLFSSIRHPQANPVERYNKTIVQMLRIYINAKHSQWVEYLDHITLALNNSIHDSTGYKPQLLQYGTENKEIWTKYFNIQKINKIILDKDEDNYEVIVENAKNNMERQYEKTSRRHDKNINKFTVFRVGDKVWVRTDRKSVKLEKKNMKFLKLYYGPATVSKCFGETSYEIVNSKNKIIGVFHVSSLKKYVQQQDTK